jgi:N-acyl-L-homoserine lactone synthetase
VKDLFEVGDTIATDLLASLAPLHFSEASDDRERKASFRLRYRAVVERNMSAVDNFPDGMECDEFDSDAIHIIGWDGDRSIATCRLVLPVPGRTFPSEKAFGLRIKGSKRAVEWGRVFVDPDYRGKDVFMGLAARGWLSMRAFELTAAIGATPERLVKLFDSMGFTVTVLSPTRLYWGEKRCLIFCDGRSAIPSLERLWCAR